MFETGGAGGGGGQRARERERERESLERETESERGGGREVATERERKRETAGEWVSERVRESVCVCGQDSCRGSVAAVKCVVHVREHVCGAERGGLRSPTLTVSSRGGVQLRGRFPLTPQQQRHLSECLPLE